MTQTAELIAQLNSLLRLTAHEASTARARVSQATSDAVREELLENASNCDERASLIRQAICDLGGAPDVVGTVVGKAVAAAKLPVEQTLPITEALLMDLGLEHQLFDRARYLRFLAAGMPDLVALAERLEEAHGNTIEWLFSVLEELAAGGPAKLAPTGVQAAATTARTAAAAAGGVVIAGLNKAVTRVERVRASR
jgi:hypothetical protein